MAGMAGLEVESRESEVCENEDSIGMSRDSPTRKYRRALMGMDVESRRGRKEAFTAAKAYENALVCAARPND